MLQSARFYRGLVGIGAGGSRIPVSVLLVVSVVFSAYVVSLLCLWCVLCALGMLFVLCVLCVLFCLAVSGCLRRFERGS